MAGKEKSWRCDYCGARLGFGRHRCQGGLSGIRGSSMAKISKRAAAGIARSMKRAYAPKQPAKVEKTVLKHRTKRKKP